MELEKRLGAYYFIKDNGQMAVKCFWEYYDKNLKMVVVCDLPNKGEK